MSEEELQKLRPGLRSAGIPPRDVLFQVSATRIPKALSETRFRIDGYRCVICGFTSTKYQMTWQYGPSPRTLADLRTVCPACWQVMNLETAAVARSGELIWLPELTQIELNRRMPEVYAERISSGGASTLARRLLVLVRGRSQEVAQHTRVDDLSDFVGALRKAEGQPERIRELTPQFDAGLRLLPLDRWIAREGDLEFNRFPQMLAYWRSRVGPLCRPSDRFVTMAHDWLSRLGEKSDGPASL